MKSNNLAIFWNKVCFNSVRFESFLILQFIFYPCDKQGCCNRVLDFFSVNKFIHMTHITGPISVNIFVLRAHIVFFDERKIFSTSVGFEGEGNLIFTLFYFDLI